MKYLCNDITFITIFIIEFVFWKRLSQVVINSSLAPPAGINMHSQTLLMKYTYRSYRCIFHHLVDRKHVYFRYVADLPLFVFIKIFYDIWRLLPLIFETCWLYLQQKQKFRLISEPLVKPASSTFILLLALDLRTSSEEATKNKEQLVLYCKL